MMPFGLINQPHKCGYWDVFFQPYKVPEDDNFWLNFLSMLKILDFLFSPAMTRVECVYLKVKSFPIITHSSFMQVLIMEHHQTFVELYPTISVTQKMQLIHVVLD